MLGYSMPVAVPEDAVEEERVSDSAWLPMPGSAV